MTQPDNTSWLGWVVSAVVGGLTGALAWFGRRELKRFDSRLDEHADQLLDLQQDRIRRADLDELRESLNATVKNSYEMTERNVERRHTEHREDAAELRGMLQEILRENR